MLEFTLLSPETSDSLDTESVSLPLLFNNFVICFSTTFCNFLSVLMDGGGGVTVGECFSFDCNMNLYVLDGSMRGKNIATTSSGISLCRILTTRPIYMANNARPYR
jgi:hypothetical protein